MSAPEISRLTEKLHITSDKIEEVTTAITNWTDDGEREGLTGELVTLQATEKDTKSLLFEEWSKNITNTNQVTDPPAHTSTSTSSRNDKTGNVRTTTHSSTILTARMTPPNNTHTELT